MLEFIKVRLNLRSEDKSCCINNALNILQLHKSTQVDHTKKTEETLSQSFLFAWMAVERHIGIFLLELPREPSYNI